MCKQQSLYTLEKHVFYRFLETDHIENIMCMHEQWVYAKESPVFMIGHGDLLCDVIGCAYLVFSLFLRFFGYPNLEDYRHVQCWFGI